MKYLLAFVLLVLGCTGKSKTPASMIGMMLNIPDKAEVVCDTFTHKYAVKVGDRYVCFVNMRFWDRNIGMVNEKPMMSLVPLGDEEIIPTMDSAIKIKDQYNNSVEMKIKSDSLVKISHIYNVCK